LLRRYNLPFMLSRLLTLLVLTSLASPVTGALQTATPPTAAETPADKPSPPDIAELLKKATSGDASAQFALAKAYETGIGVRQNLEQSAIWYRKAAEQGNAKAQNSLGVLYWLGTGVAKDKKEAVQWYRKAARQGDSTAMFNLGAAYYNGEGVGVNDTLAYAWFLLSSDAGNTSGQDAANRSRGEHGPGAYNDACFTIGEFYEKGDDLPKNVNLAASWYRKAAEGGHSQAQVNLAILAMNAKDYGETRRWCEMAAKSRHAGGAACLGYLYQHGLGVTQDSKEAVKWYQQGVLGGNRAATRALAEMYANGEGVKRDPTGAFVWFFILFRKGDEGALSEAQKLRLSMTQKEWKDTEKKLRQQGLDPKKVDSILQTAGSQPPK